MTAVEEVFALAQMRADVLSGRARELRELAHLTQAEVARAVRVTQSAVAQWEAGRRLPRGKPAARYADFLWQLDRATREPVP